MDEKKLKEKLTEILGRPRFHTLSTEARPLLIGSIMEATKECEEKRKKLLGR